MQEVVNILRIFKQARVAFEKEDSALLRELSDQTINTASRTQDPDNITTAVIIYALGKIIERVAYRKERSWKKFHRNILMFIDGIIFALEKNDEAKLRKNLQELRGSISGLSGDLKRFIEDEETNLSDIPDDYLYSEETQYNPEEEGTYCNYCGKSLDEDGGCPDWESESRPDDIPEDAEYDPILHGKYCNYCGGLYLPDGSCPVCDSLEK